MAMHPFQGHGSAGHLFAFTVIGEEGLGAFFALAVLVFLSTRLYRLTGPMQSWSSIASRWVWGLAVAAGLLKSLLRFSAKNPIWRIASGPESLLPS